MGSKVKISILGLSFLMVLFVMFSIEPPEEVEASCGVTSSSCIVCHEDEGQLPVNTLGVWHTDHAFGDFCQACHLGDGTQTEKAAAHEGLIRDGLSQPEESCKTCHSGNYETLLVNYTNNATSPNSNNSTPLMQPQLTAQVQNPGLTWQTWVVIVLNTIAAFVVGYLVGKLRSKS